MKLTKSKLQQIIKEELEAQMQTEKVNPDTGLDTKERYVQRLDSWAMGNFEFEDLSEMIEWTERALDKIRKDVEFDTKHVPDMDDPRDRGRMARGETH